MVGWLGGWVVRWLDRLSQPSRVSETSRVYCFCSQSGGGVRCSRLLSSDKTPALACGASVGRLFVILPGTPFATQLRCYRFDVLCYNQYGLESSLLLAPLRE
jgi:hypothetical protein